MKVLVLFFHNGIGDAPYKAAIKATGLDPSQVDFIVVNKGNGSAVYDHWVTSLRGTGTTLERVCEDVGAGRPRAYRRVILASFSAGYGATRAIVRDRSSARQVHGFVFLDSLHSGFDPDGTARDDQLEMFVPLALRAAERRAVFMLGHTDVWTPRPGMAGAFASTKEVAEELARFVEMQPPRANTRQERGDLVVEFFDREPATRQRSEHGRALTDWGPAFLAEAVKRSLDLEVEETIPSMGAITLDDEDQPPWGLRALTRSITYAARSVSERTHAELIKSWHANAGHAWMDPVKHAWCASFASSMALETHLDGDVYPHALTPRVREILSSAIARDTAVPIAEVRRAPERYLQPGNLLLMARGHKPAPYGPNAIGTGHVARIERVEGEVVQCVDGNVGNEVARRRYGLDEDRLVAVVLYPGAGEIDTWAPSLEVIEALTAIEAGVAV